MRKLTCALGILGLTLLIGLLVAWDDQVELMPLATIYYCDPAFFPPAVDTFVSDTFIYANIGKTIGGDCASKKGQSFYMASRVDWVPDLVGPKTFGIRSYVSGAGTSCVAGWSNFTIPSGQKAYDVGLNTGNCIFSSTGTYQGYVKYRTPSTSTSTGSTVMATSVLSYQ